MTAIDTDPASGGTSGAGVAGGADGTSGAGGGGAGGDTGGALQGPRVGRTELGTISVQSAVVSKIASRAASEIPDAGAAAPRILGRSLSGAGALGVRETSLSALPKSACRVDGNTALIEVSISVRWPASVPQVSQAVREHVRSRVNELTGLQVLEVAVRVTDLVTDLAPPPRVR